jgi:uncharacterized protein YlxW (UPF0749 family)
MKKLAVIIVTLACLVMACSLFFILRFSPADSLQASTAQTVTASEQRVQSQINGLSTKLANFDSLVSQLQSRTKALENPTASPTDQTETTTAEAQNLAAQVVSLKTQITALQTELKSADVKNLNAEFSSLQTQVAELQDRLKVAETAIGNTPVTVNGLSIIFISNNINVGATGSSSPGAAQFAIKIINNTGSALANIDVTGTITGSQNFSENIAPGYPQILDGAGLCTYVSFIKQSNLLYWEGFGAAKTNLTIPAGSSITLRPRMSILAATGKQFPDMTFSLALNAITFDRTPAK